MATVTRADSAPPRSERRLSLQTFSAFQSRNFALLWANNLTFALSQSFRQFAFTWLALELFDTGQALGLIIFALGLPILVFGLPAGALADRVDRRLLLFASQVGGIAITLLTAALIWADAMTTPITMGLAMTLGATVAFGQPVRVAIVPSLVEPSKLLNAVTLMSLSQNVSMIAGPAMGGAMVALGGVGMAFAGQAVLLGIGLLALLPLRVPAVDRTGPPRHMLAEVREGLVFVARHPGIRTLMLVLLTTALVMAGTFMTLLPKISLEELEVGPFRTSMFFTAMGVGMLMSSLLLASFSRLDRAGLWFIVTLVCGGTLNAAFGLSLWYYLSLAIMFATGWNAGFFTNLNLTLIQANTPHAVMGRVMSIYTLSMAGGMPLGGLLAGLMSDVWGSREWFVACGLALVAIGVAVLLTQPSLRRMRSSGGETPG
ncbi:MAG: MFS transporter [Chloroflexi bacterium]|nr:MFS transporter [Chloroflexota bacterium]